MHVKSVCKIAPTFAALELVRDARGVRLEKAIGTTADDVSVVAHLCAGACVLRVKGSAHIEAKLRARVAERLRVYLAFACSRHEKVLLVYMSQCSIGIGTVNILTVLCQVLSRWAQKRATDL